MSMTMKSLPRVLACFLPLLLAAACGTGQSARSPLPPTTVPADAGDRAQRFVLELLDARQEGDAELAQGFLSPTARDQFAAGEGGLRLTGGYTSAALLSLEQADASSWEARVRLETADGAVEEYLFVGAGPGPDGKPRELTVRGAQRVAAAGEGATP
jgi:hypothetical protein